jgi:hypothetical protein
VGRGHDTRPRLGTARLRKRSASWTERRAQSHEWTNFKPAGARAVASGVELLRLIGSNSEYEIASLTMSALSRA